MERSKRQKQYDLEALSYEDPSLYKALMQKQQSEYTPNQIAEFGTIQDYDPTYRDNTKQKFLRNKDGDLRGIFNALGMDDYQARDLSERLFGGGPRNLGIGLLDFTGAGVPFGIQEGSRTYARGKNTDDNITKGLGALEVGLGFAEALPLAALATKPLKLGIRSLAGKIKKLSGVDYDETVNATVDESRRNFITKGAAAAGALAIAPEILTGVVKSAGRIAPNVARAASSLDLSVAKINALIKRKESLAQQADELRLDPRFSDSMQASKRNDVTNASIQKDLESYKVEIEIEQAAVKALDDLNPADFANAADDSIETIAEQFSNYRYLEDQIDNPAFDGLMEQVKLRGMNSAKDARGIDQFPYARSIFEDYYNPIDFGGVKVPPSMFKPPVPKSLNMVRPVATDIKKGMTELKVLEVNKRMQLREEKMIAEGNSASEIDAMKAELRQELYKVEGLPSDIGDFYADGGAVMNGVGSLNETARNMTRGPRGIGAYQQFADGGPVYMKDGGNTGPLTFEDLMKEVELLKEDPVEQAAVAALAEKTEKQNLAQKADIASRYKLNPEDSGIRSLYKKIPTNMRLYIENLLGDTSTITENDFTNKELIEIIALIEKQQAVNIKEEQILKEEGSNNKSFVTKGTSTEDALASYEDTRDRTSVNPYAEPTYYSGTSHGMVDDNYSSSFTRSFNDPMYNVATSLGKYTATDVDDGYNIREKYDFNRGERNLPTNFSEVLQYISASPELAGEYLSSILGSKPRDVDINLQRINAANR